MFLATKQSGSTGSVPVWAVVCLPPGWRWARWSRPVSPAAPPNRPRHQYLRRCRPASCAAVILLNEGSVAVSHIGQAKYGGRVDANVSTARTSDVSAALIERGLVRRYSGGKRDGWCG